MNLKPFLIVFSSVSFPDRMSWVVFLLQFLQFTFRFPLRYGDREYENNLERVLYFMKNIFSCFSQISENPLGMRSQSKNR